MKVIVAGSRNITDSHLVATAIAKSGFDIAAVVSGGARGVDTLGEQWAHQTGRKIARFSANWKRDGNAAGPIRNAHMANYADALVAIWDGESRGTRHMIDTMKKQGKPVYVHKISDSTVQNSD